MFRVTWVRLTSTRMLAAPRALALLTALLLATIAVLALPASAQKLKQRSAGTSLKTLVRQTNALPPAATSKAKKRYEMGSGASCAADEPATCSAQYSMSFDIDP